MHPARPFISLAAALSLISWEAAAFGAAATHPPEVTKLPPAQELDCSQSPYLKASMSSTDVGDDLMSKLITQSENANGLCDSNRKVDEKIYKDCLEAFTRAGASIKNLGQQYTDQCNKVKTAIADSHKCLASGQRQCLEVQNKLLTDLEAQVRMDQAIVRRDIGMLVGARENVRKAAEKYAGDISCTLPSPDSPHGTTSPVEALTAITKMENGQVVRTPSKPLNEITDAFETADVARIVLKEQDAALEGFAAQARAMKRTLNPARLGPNGATITGIGDKNAATLLSSATATSPGPKHGNPPPAPVDSRKTPASPGDSGASTQAKTSPSPKPVAPQQTHQEQASAPSTSGSGGVGRFADAATAMMPAAASLAKTFGAPPLPTNGRSAGLAAGSDSSESRRPASAGEKSSPDASVETTGGANQTEKNVSSVDPADQRPSALSASSRVVEKRKQRNSSGSPAGENVSARPLHGAVTGVSHEVDYGDDFQNKPRAEACTGSSCPAQASGNSGSAFSSLAGGLFGGGASAQGESPNDSAQGIEVSRGALSPEVDARLQIPERPLEQVSTGSSEGSLGTLFQRVSLAHLRSIKKGLVALPHRKN